MTDADDNWIQHKDDAIRQGKRLVEGVEEFNRVADHIVSLLSNATTLYLAGSVPTAAFLAITALEETAKAHVGMHRKSGTIIKRNKDPLYSHPIKHFLAAAPTVAMGSRLAEAIGAERVSAIMEKAREGELVHLRENAIYFDRTDGALQVPADVIDRIGTREILLFSIEAFDDALVGFTDYSMELSRRTDEMFISVAA